MIIHFVCVGNTYRSRMAEAYCNSFKLPGIKIISSGIHASDNENGPISWVAARILKKNNLVPFMSAYWQQTSKELLESNDRIIFFSEEYKQYCLENFTKNIETHEVWEIADINLKLLGASEKNKAFDDDLIKQSEETFETIKKKVDELITSLQLP